MHIWLPTIFRHKMKTGLKLCRSCNFMYESSLSLSLYLLQSLWVELTYSNLQYVAMNCKPGQDWECAQIILVIPNSKTSVGLCLNDLCVLEIWPNFKIHFIKTKNFITSAPIGSFFTSSVCSVISCSDFSSPSIVSDFWSTTPASLSSSIFKAFCNLKF